MKHKEIIIIMKYSGLLLLILFLQALQPGFAQKQVYTTSGGEMIFQMSDVNSGGSEPETNLRWTVFLHLGSYTHMDFTNNIGMYSGLALRNIGFISNEDDPNNPGNYMKTIRRTYNLGIPLALKLGSFDNNMYLFGGGEYEWQFLYKEKYWPNGGGERDGEKRKYHAWFSKRVNQFIPSLFVGIQLPKGINVKFKYYMENYMNQNYTHPTQGKIYSDLDVKLYYVSVSWNIRNNEIMNSVKEGNINYSYLTR